jgi:hypothetical protein
MSNLIDRDEVEKIFKEMIGVCNQELENDG